MSIGITRPAGGDERKMRGAGERGKGGWRTEGGEGVKRLESIKSRGNRSRLSIKGGREADVRPHTDNSTECSMEFMRFNPLRNPREAALFSSALPCSPPPPMPPCYGGLRGLRMISARRRGKGEGGGNGCTPETAGSKVQEEESSPLVSSCLVARKSEL